MSRVGNRLLPLFFLLLWMITYGIGCGGASKDLTPTSQGDPVVSTGAVPQIGHIALVVFENQKEDASLGNPHMPWLSNLARQNAYAANYFANVHPSLGNYFYLTTGQNISNDLNFAGVVDVPNLIRAMNAAGKSWKAYEESIPSVGYLGDGPLPYVKTHNPAAYLSDVRNDPTQAAKMVPLDQLQSDMAAGNLPQFMFVEPNQVNTMHDCPATEPLCTNDDKLAVGDAWAQQHLAPLLNDPNFQKDGLLIVTWDESWDTDSQNGGGHVLTILAGTQVKKQFVSSTTFYQHQSVLRMISDAMQLPAPGAAANAPNMGEFFVGN